MHPVLDYLLKANLLLVFFGLFYHLFLKSETFYKLNRWYFIACVFISLTAPFISFTKTVFVEPIPVEFFVNDQQTISINEPVEEPSFLETIDLQQALVYLILLLSVALVIRKIYAVVKLYRSIKKLPSLGASNIKITADNKTVYSFYQWIVVPENFFQWQNHKMILDHESIHLNQKHTFDLILIELVAAVFWFNPLVKVMQRAINTNLEFIVDQKMIKTTDRVLYQKNLLEFQAQKSIQFVNSYNASKLKNRILQLNAKKSNNMKKLKLVITLPVLVAFFTLFQVETIAQVKENLEVQETEETSFLVRENFTKEDFAKLSEELKANFDINFSVKNIKYENNKIISLDYIIRNKDLKIAASETGNDKNIDPFLIIVNLNDHEPFKFEKYSAKPTFSYTVDNEIEPNFSITEDEWKDGSWVKKISNDQKVIYIIDGSRSSKGVALTLNPKDILSINVHGDQETKNKFDEAVDNIVIIKTKKVKDVTNLEKDLELLLSDRKAFDRIAAKYPIYVDEVLLTKKQLKNFDTKTIRSSYFDENVTEIRLTTRKSENETFSFKIEDDYNDLDYYFNDNNKQNSAGTEKPYNKIMIDGKEATEEEWQKFYRTAKNFQARNENKVIIVETNFAETNRDQPHTTVKIGNNKLKYVYLLNDKEISGEDFGKIHPGDIERIDVLKDKKTIEKYGDKAKDGVLLIITKAKKEVSLQQKAQALKARELAFEKRNEVVANKKRISQHKQIVEKQRQKLLAKRKETVIVSNKKSDKKLLHDDYKTLTGIFNDVNKTVK